VKPEEEAATAGIAIAARPVAASARLVIVIFALP
jgi:hypothetical protein